MIDVHNAGLMTVERGHIETHACLVLSLEGHFFFSRYCHLFCTNIENVTDNSSIRVHAEQTNMTRVQPCNDWSAGSLDQPTGHTLTTHTVIIAVVSNKMGYRTPINLASSLGLGYQDASRQGIMKTVFPWQYDLYTSDQFAFYKSKPVIALVLV